MAPQPPSPSTPTTSKSARVRNSSASAEREKKKPKRDEDEPSTSRRDRSKEMTVTTSPKNEVSPSSSKRDHSKEKPSTPKVKSPPSAKRDHSKESFTSPTRDRNTGLQGEYWKATPPTAAQPRSAKLSASTKIEGQITNEDSSIAQDKKETVMKSPITSPKSNGVATKTSPSSPTKDAPSTSKSNGESSKKARDESKSPKTGLTATPKSSKANGESSKKTRDESKSPPKGPTTTPKAAKSNGESSKKEKEEDKSPKKTLTDTPKTSKGSASTSKKDKDDSKSTKKDNEKSPEMKKNGESSKNVSKKEDECKKSAKKDTDKSPERKKNGESSTKKDKKEADSPKKDDPVTPKSSKTGGKNSGTTSPSKNGVKEGRKRDRTMNGSSPSKLLSSDSDNDASGSDDEEEEEYKVEKVGSDSEEDKYTVEKGFNLHYPGKVYVLKKETERKDDEERPTRVQRILDYEHLGEDDMWKMADKVDAKCKGVHEMDFVVGCTDPKVPWDSDKAKCSSFKMLICYKGMPRGEWQEYDATDTIYYPAIVEFVNVQKQFDKIETILKEECAARKLRYKDLYPSRYLTKRGREYYGNTKLHILRTLQMARQHDLNDINREDGVPPIYIADWSGIIHDFRTSSIYTFKFINYAKISRRVEKKLESGNIERMDEHCKAECPCADETLEGRCTCHHKKTKYSRRHECSECCRCRVDKCNNRTVQRGRQLPIVTMKHHKKGWTNRLYDAVEEGDFVHEYVGELVTYHENRSMDQTYALDQSDSLWDLSKPPNREDKHRARRHNFGKPEKGYCHRALVMNGLRAANEARFTSHGCRPKMRTIVTYVDRDSYGLHRTAFFADKDLRAGEELTWNYHGEGLDEALLKGEGFPSGILPKCDCGEPDCPITKNTKPYVEDKEPDNDYDSFPDSDEEKEKEELASRTNNRKNRLEKRDQLRKSSNAENESEGSSGSSPSPAASPAQPALPMDVGGRDAFSPQL